MVVGRDIQRNLTNRSRFTLVHGRGDPAWSVMKRSVAVLCGTGAFKPIRAFSRNESENYTRLF